MRAFPSEYDTFIEYGRGRSEGVLERSESESTIFSAREGGSNTVFNRQTVNGLELDFAVFNINYRQTTM